MDNKQKCLEKEIDLIQACINRMAKNSFIVKGWAISLASVILALLPKNVDIKLLSIIVIVSTICFWYVDAFFLKTEKLYRWKYEWVIINRYKSDNYLYDLNPYNKEMWIKTNNKERNIPCTIRVMFTRTLVPLYGLLIALSTFLFVNSYFNFISILVVENPISAI